MLCRLSIPTRKGEEREALALGGALRLAGLPLGLALSLISEATLPRQGAHEWPACSPMTTSSSQDDEQTGAAAPTRADT